MNIRNDATVFTFAMYYDWDCKPEDRQERYVVAFTEEEAIKKFSAYLDKMASEGFARPVTYTYYPVVELQDVII